MTFGALLLGGVSEFLYKVAHDDSIHEAPYLCLQSGVVFCTCALISFGGVGWRLTPATVVIGIGSGLCAFTTALSLLYAMGRGPASVTSAMRRLGFIVTGILAIALLGERLTVTKAIGAGLAALGLLIVAWAPHQDHRPHPLIYLSAVMSGFVAFAHKLGANAGVSPSAFLMLQAGTVHVSAHLFCQFTGGYRFTRAAFRIAPITGSLIAVGMLLSIYALRRGEAIVIVPLLQLSFLVTAPLSFVLLREPITRRKLAGIALGTAAVLVFGLAL